MAQLKYAMKILERLEFNNPTNVLHTNPTEQGWTYYGIYQKAHPYWVGWQIIEQTINAHRDPQGNFDRRKVSTILFQNQDLTELVYELYDKLYWSEMKGNEIHSQHIANEIFIFGVNVGMKIAIKAAQRITNVLDDGKLGPISLAAINAADERQFDKIYDQMEIAYYNNLIARRPQFKIYANGWRNRALAV